MAVEDSVRARVRGHTIQTIPIAEQTIVGNGVTDATVDIDLRSYVFNGFIMLKLESTEITLVGGLDNLAVTAQVIVRNNANDTWILPANSSAIEVEDDVDIATVGKMAAWDINWAFFWRGGFVDDFLSLEGIRFVLSEATAGDSGKCIGKVILR